MQNSLKNSFDQDDVIKVTKHEKIVLMIIGAIFLSFILLVGVAFFTAKKDIVKTNDTVVENEIENEIIFYDSVDYDNDGLEYAEEIAYGTNPNSRDTDNDGYMDADEIFSGYNPLGDGDLPQHIIDAQKKLSVEYCQSLDFEFRKCFEDLAIQERKYEYCEMNSSNPDNCIKQVAEFKRDIPKCKTLKYENQQTSCILNIAKYSADLGICEIIKNTNSYEACISKVAIAKQDTSLCETLKNGLTKDTCFGYISILRNDFNLCSSIGKNNTLCLKILTKTLEDTDEVKSYLKSEAEKEQLAKEKVKQDINEIKKDILKNQFSLKTIVITLVVYFILFLIGLMVSAGIYNLALNILNIGDANNFEKCLKIALILSLIRLVLSIFKLFLLFTGVSSFAILFGFIEFCISVFVFNYLFNKYFQTSIVQNIIIYLISFVIILILSTILTFIFGFILSLFFLSLGSSGFGGIGF